MFLLKIKLGLRPEVLMVNNSIVVIYCNSPVTDRFKCLKYQANFSPRKGEKILDCSSSFCTV